MRNLAYSIAIWFLNGMANLFYRLADWLDSLCSVKEEPIENDEARPPDLEDLLRNGQNKFRKNIRSVK